MIILESTSMSSIVSFMCGVTMALVWLADVDGAMDPSSLLRFSFVRLFFTYLEDIEDDNEDNELSSFNR